MIRITVHAGYQNRNSIPWSDQPLSQLNSIYLSHYTHMYVLVRIEACVCVSANVLFFILLEENFNQNFIIFQALRIHAESSAIMTALCYPLCSDLKILIILALEQNIFLEGRISQFLHVCLVMRTIFIIFAKIKISKRKPVVNQHLH